MANGARSRGRTITDPVTKLQKLRWPIGLTRAGLVAERLARAFWPLWSLALVCLAALWLGWHDAAPVEVVWAAIVAVVIAAFAFLVRGLRRFRWPSRAEAMVRLDSKLPGRPIQSLIDDQAIGMDDPASQAVWAAHQARMMRKVQGLRPAEPDMKLARFDPYGLRHVAMLLFLVGVLFGSVGRVASLGDMAPGSQGDLAGGPAWEGWVEPPAYTGLPTLYLNEILQDGFEAPKGSRVSLRFYGEVGALTLSETVSERVTALPSAAEPAQEFTVHKPGRIVVDGPGGRAWDVSLRPDAPPKIAIDGPSDTSARGEMSLPFTAEDDYAVTGGTARIELDLQAIDRRYGLARDPEPRDAIEVQIPMPLTGRRDSFSESLIEDFSEHPWAHLPVRLQLEVLDAPGQAGRSENTAMDLPARRFFDPLAAAIVEQRRDLLWTRDNAARVARVLRALSHRPDGVFPKETTYLRLRYILRRLETFNEFGLSPEQRDEIAQALWDLAMSLEEGDLSDALERLRRAQDRLAEAMKNGASDAEIAELMQELRRATEDYMRQLAQQDRRDQENADGDREMAENSMTMSQDDLQRMMDRIQELMEQGRMAEAMEALRELQELMENMRVTQGQGEGQQSPGQQAMEDLADTLRQQQGLSDQAFRDLQEQFNPGANRGQSQGNEGRSGGDGRGQSHDGTGQGQGQGQEGQQGQPGESDLAGSLADRQRALRDELDRQRGNLPGSGTPEGDAARESLGRAGDAMEGAEEALRRDDLAEAIDRQAEAMEALRDGMRNLGEAMAQQQQRNQGQQGTAQGDPQGQQRDPLGRNRGTDGQVGTDERLLQGEDVYRRARDLLEEIRRRAGETERPDVERDYLRRLLDRF